MRDKLRAICSAMEPQTLYRTFATTPAYEKRNLKFGSVDEEKKKWVKWSLSRMMITTHTTDIRPDFLLALRSILEETANVDLGAIIGIDIWDRRSGDRTLGHGTLITELCRCAGVNLPTSAPEFQMKPLFPAAFHKNWLESKEFTLNPKQKKRNAQAAAPPPPKRKMKVVEGGGGIIREEITPQTEPDSKRTISNKTPSDEEEEALRFAREIEEDHFGAEVTSSDKGGKAPKAAAGEKRSKEKEDPTPAPVKKPRVKEALRKNPTPPRRATRKEKEKGKAVDVEASEDTILLSRLQKGIVIREPTAQPERLSPVKPAMVEVSPEVPSLLGNEPVPFDQQGAGEPTTAGTGKETAPVNQPRAVEPTAAGLEEEWETVLTEETIGGIDVTVESYKEYPAEVPAATTAEAANEAEEVETVITNLPLLQVSPRSPKTPTTTGTPAETLTLASTKSDKTIIDEEEDEEDKKFQERQAQLFAEIQRLEQLRQLERQKKRKMKVLVKLLKYWKPLTQLQLRFRRYLERKKVEQLEYEAARQLVFLRNVTPEPAPNSQKEEVPLEISSAESERQSPAAAEAGPSAPRSSLENIERRLEELDSAIFSQYMMTQTLIDTYARSLADELATGKKANAALEARVEAMETKAASMGTTLTEILKALAALTQQNSILMEQQLDTARSLQRMEDLVLSSEKRK
ncbi:uncharacterized protein LOC127256891 [Andrographis paniculata]|uniref:uncharacterized protein LOC127256891 n=1 Tax=Andrographis paniculata TaxID=175694 RepID=UPI0021E8FBE0|nr:uncharacterized protein LOC127256891 [Andrographis paniculata]